MTRIDDAFDFDGDAVCVTGAAQGIGRAVAEAFATQSANTVIADIDGDKAEAAASEITAEYDTRAIGVEADVTDYQSAQRMIDTTVDTFGGVDVLVNNAGVAGTQSFVDSEPADWQRKIGVSLYGTLNSTHAVLPYLLEQGEGSVINYASSSYRGNDPGLSVYGAAKAANRSFTKTVAKEVGDQGVRINCVCPGTVRTPATADFVDKYEDELGDSYALGRVGEPEDVADAVVFLASDAARWITGETLHVDGGYVRR